MGNGVPLERQSKPYKVHLKQHQCPGDVLVMTAAVESLKRTYGSSFRVSVDTTCMDIWKHNPHVEQLVPAECHVVNLEYPLIGKCNQLPVHFIQGFVENLSSQLKIPLEVQTNRPHLYLSADEKQLFPLPNVPRPYVIVNAGHKSDFTAKYAGHQTYQKIVDHLRGKLTFVQVGEKNVSHTHLPLTGALNLIGKTSARELFRLAYHSACGVGPVSFLHHVYAAFQKPYVCYVGGREPIAWENYPTAVMLGTHGQLPCCATTACWKSRTVPLGDNTDKDRSLCSLPVLCGGETIPKCMAMLGSSPAIRAIESMIDSGVINMAC